MATQDGATVARKKLRNAAGKTEAQSITLSGADLEHARLLREAQSSGAKTGADLEQLSGGVPRIGSLTVVTGLEAGGTDTVVIGQGFTDATSVTFDAVAGTSFSVVDDNRIDVTSPAGTGVVDVVVVTPDGNDTLAAAWTYT